MDKHGSREDVQEREEGGREVWQEWIEGLGVVPGNEEIMEDSDESDKTYVPSSKDEDTEPEPAQETRQCAPS